ncbi:MAG: signal peptidase II [Candidatus Uhrbacteria bacterium]|nr:signal peptidase II [Candidatus Uhrbacteria bacterium]
MSSTSLRVYWYLLPVAAIVVLDEWLKFTALHRLPEEGSLVDPGILEFAIHKNWGVVFDIPFRLEFIILVSVVIGLGLLRIVYKNRLAHPDITLATGIIILGALGNLYDRIVYGFTVDYIILFARSAINLSDVVIVTGVIALLLRSRRSAHLTREKK